MALNEIDIEGRHLGYFHNADYHELHGEDFDEVLRVRGSRESSALPPQPEHRRQMPHPLLHRLRISKPSVAWRQQHSLQRRAVSWQPHFWQTRAEP